MTGRPGSRSKANKLQSEDVDCGKSSDKKGSGNEATGDCNASDEAAAASQYIDRTQVVLPLEPLTLVNCKFRDDKWYPSRILERRPVEHGEADEYEYYVHYRKLNRRMDEWTSLSNLDLDTVILPEFLEDPLDPKSKRRRIEDEHSEEEGEGHEVFDPEDLKNHAKYTKVKNVERIELGRFEMETWYFSPIPEEYRNAKKLYFCEYDLAFFTRKDTMVRHLKKVRLQHPPGVEIYRHHGISVFEVDGAESKTYCQNLAYLAKMFLDHKELTYDIDLFLFYILCECDDRGAHIVGYFSKTKDHKLGFNLACILTLPAYQRRGYGKFLISFSYELSKLEKKVGTPERPLSDLGLVSYRGYWTRVLLGILKTQEGSISIEKLSELTMIKPDDIISTLQHLKMIQYVKGQHVLCAASHIIEAHLKACGSPGLEVEPSKIIWTPQIQQKDVKK